MSDNFIAIHHISFIVSDINVAKHFYIEVLGLELDHSRTDLSFDGLWLNINDSQQIHLLHLDNPDSSERPEHGGRDRHAAFVVKNLAKIELRLKQYKIPYTLSKSGRVALFCRDSDGNTLEIME